MPDLLNATLIHREDVSPNLCVLRIQPDEPLFEFHAGQYTVIGLPADAPRVPFAEVEEDPPKPGSLIRRAYSIASSSKAREYIELYISLVRSGTLTPRLFLLQEGDRLWMGPKATGYFTLREVPDNLDVILVGTGTGLAPYISMIRSEHQCNGARKVTVVHGARHTWDLGYRGELEALRRQCGNFRYLPTLTRPGPEENWQGHVGRIQSVFLDGTVPTDPQKSHVFLCGHPEMVETMQALLLERGYTLHAPRTPGTLHVERYW